MTRQQVQSQERRSIAIFDSVQSLPVIPVDKSVFKKTSAEKLNLKTIKIRFKKEVENGFHPGLKLRGRRIVVNNQ